MKIFFRILFILFLTGSVFSLSALYFWYKPKFHQGAHAFQSLNTSSEEFARLQTRASFLKKYSAANRYSSKICFLVDMKIPSGRKRFFVYDLQRDSILVSGLVAHGSCDNGFQIEANFSNQVNSGCSCMGKFRVGNGYTGRFGPAYKLYGLDSSNSNTYQRTIVLHSYACVPELEIYPLPVCNSRGCPMVSPGFLQKLKPYIESSGKPILLNIFY
jgi:L,D-transpeptidase catalytic domain